MKLDLYYVDSISCIRQWCIRQWRRKSETMTTLLLSYPKTSACDLRVGFNISWETPCCHILILLIHVTWCSLTYYPGKIFAQMSPSIALYLQTFALFYAPQLESYDCSQMILLLKRFSWIMLAPSISNRHFSNAWAQFHILFLQLMHMGLYLPSPNI